MSTLIPTTIDEDLIPVLYTMFEGKEYNISGKKVKGVKIDLKSSLGRYIRMMCVKAERPDTKRFYNIVFEVQDLSSKNIQDQFTNTSMEPTIFLNFQKNL